MRERYAHFRNIYTSNAKCPEWLFVFPSVLMGRDKLKHKHNYTHTHTYIHIHTPHHTYNTHTGILDMIVSVLSRI